MRGNVKRLWLGATAALLAALVISACGSGGSQNSGDSESDSSPAIVAGLKQTGPGLTLPTSPPGPRLSGGTVYFSEEAASPPNYIFPMYSAQYCGINNIDQLNVTLYRPLYWYGDRYSPTVDYDKSIGHQPVFSDQNRTVTVHLNPYRWSDGEPVSSRDVVFWMNLLKADPAQEWCGYVPGRFPDNVTGVSAPNPSTVVFHLNRSYNPTWFLYNELSEIYPLPLAWDRTSLSQPEPRADNGHLPDTTHGGATAVYDFLNAQGTKISSWATSPLWSVVDGPMRVSDTTSDGGVTLSPNPDYSGTPKARVSVDEVPFTTDTALFDEIRSGGPKSLTVTALPPQDVPQKAAVMAEGYTDNSAASYSVNFFPLNFQNPTVGPVFRQTYFRQAFQHLIDQPGWISAFLNHSAVPTYGPVPTVPVSPLVSAGAGANPFPFSPSAAARLLTDHGWKVVAGGVSTCIKPGTGRGDCGADISRGEKIAFNLDFATGMVSLTSEMDDLQAQARKVGITITLTSHPFDDVYSAAVHCTAAQPKCGWAAENWDGGWIYGPDEFPSGEDLFAAGSVADFSNYDDRTMNALIQQTTVGSPADEAQNMARFVTFTEKQLPVVFGPTSVGTFGPSAGQLISRQLGGYSANAFGFLDPEDWYLVK